MARGMTVELLKAACHNCCVANDYATTDGQCGLCHCCLESQMINLHRSTALLGVLRQDGEMITLLPFSPPSAVDSAHLSSPALPGVQHAKGPPASGLLSGTTGHQFTFDPAAEC